jgi:hypothetical protein
MRTLSQSRLGFIAALALVGAAHAQMPSTNDTSSTDYRYNTGGGSGALGGGAVTGPWNTAYGFETLLSDTGGEENTAFGAQALTYNTAGNNNTAAGYTAMYSNTSGNDNTAVGYEALYTNTGGNYNNASGYFALHSNSSGSQNSAAGVQALYGNKTGNYNTASGTDALFSNTSGSSNIAEGYKAGFNLTTGSNNIDIGNQGVTADSGKIRIGTTSTQTATYIAGIYGTSVTGSAVVVSSSGQLGVTVSSERFKTDITAMGSNSQKLQRLRPVIFHLKTDPHGSLQYGLIAEEVAKVYPDLVIRDQNGRIDGLRYDELAPMLLNEMQRQKNAAAEVVAAQAAEIRALKLQQARDRQEQSAELQDLKQELHAALDKLQAEDERVAQR